jgi:hypothetical protein
MREPKRLAHRQAERNRARVLKRWNWDDDEDSEEPIFVDADPLVIAPSADGAILMVPPGHLHL